MITDRILRGCYSALYSEFLPEQTPNYTLMPLVECESETEEAHPSNFHPQHKHFCELLKFNRRINNINQVFAYNKKIRFEIVWTYADDNMTPMGVFCIDIYDWHKLSKGVLPRVQGCVGFLSSTKIPQKACFAQKAELIYRYKEALNPFD